MIDDDKLIEILNEQIEDTRNYYNDPNGFGLDEKRAPYFLMYTGEQANPEDYYDQDVPYIEKQYVGIDSIMLMLQLESTVSGYPI